MFVRFLPCIFHLSFLPALLLTPLPLSLSLADTIRNLMEKLQEDWQDFEREEHVTISTTYVTVLVLVLLLKPNAIYLALAGVLYLAWRARERISASFLRAVDASKLQMEMEKKKKESLANRR